MKHRDRSDDPAFYSPELNPPYGSLGFLVADSHDCDACGTDIEDPDETLCKACKWHEQLREEAAQS